MDSHMKSPSEVQDPSGPKGQRKSFGSILFWHLPRSLRQTLLSLHLAHLIPTVSETHFANLLPQALSTSLVSPYDAGYRRISCHPSLLRSVHHMAVKAASETSDYSAGEEVEILRGKLEWAVLVVLRQLKEAKAARKSINSSTFWSLDSALNDDIFSRAFILACAAFGESASSATLTSYASVSAKYMMELDMVWKDPSFKRSQMTLPKTASDTSRHKDRQLKARSKPEKRKSRHRRHSKQTRDEKDGPPNPSDLPSRFVDLYQHFPRRFEPLTKAETQRINRKAFTLLTSRWTKSSRPLPPISSYLDISAPAKHNPLSPIKFRDRNPYTLVGKVQDPTAPPIRQPMERWYGIMKRAQDRQLRDFLLATSVCKKALQELTESNDGVYLRTKSNRRGKRCLIPYCVLSAFFELGRDEKEYLLVNYVRAAVAGMLSLRWTLACRDYRQWKALHPDVELPQTNKFVLETLMEEDEEDEN
ncbi:hypothetical protein BT69DRAFT_1277957, partial [Atractiella rhizophila]